MINKYFTILALSLCACAHQSTTTVSTTRTPEATVVPSEIELRNGQKANVIACHDDMDCYKKVTGLCVNGYSGAQMLVAENDRRVGIMYVCITNEQKAERAKEEAREKAAQARWEKINQQREEAAEAEAAHQQAVVGPSKVADPPRQQSK